MKQLLNGRSGVPFIGEETGRTYRTGTSVYKSQNGSIRYVLRVAGVAVSALQVVSADNMTATIAHVYTAIDCRRRGYASLLLHRARKDFLSVSHAEPSHLTTLGEYFAEARP